MQDLRETENMKDVYNPIVDKIEIQRALKDVYNSIRENIKNKIQAETNDRFLTDKLMHILIREISL